MLALTAEPIEPAALLNAVMRPNCGGVVLFLGTVRDLTLGQPTVALEYEAHSTMTENELLKIVNESKSKWPVGGIAVAHRLGYLDISEIAVGVAVSCPHRTDAFAAAKYVIDEIKKRAPIWKRDHTPDGASAWVHPGT